MSTSRTRRFLISVTRAQLELLREAVTAAEGACDDADARYSAIFCAACNSHTEGLDCTCDDWDGHGGDEWRRAHRGRRGRHVKGCTVAKARTLLNRLLAPHRQVAAAVTTSPTTLV